jgi:hypothetical protein
VLLGHAAKKEGKGIVNRGLDSCYYPPWCSFGFQYNPGYDSKLHESGREKERCCCCSAYYTRRISTGCSCSC